MSHCQMPAAANHMSKTATAGVRLADLAAFG